MNADNDTQTDDTEQAYQVTLEGHGAYSAPYLDKQKAEENAERFSEDHPDTGEFYVEEWTDYERSVDTETEHAGGPDE